MGAVPRLQCTRNTKQDNKEAAVVLENPMAKEFQMVRTSLFPGLCKTLKNQKSVSSKGGIKIFEVSDVCLIDDSTDVGARNERMCAAMYCGSTAGFEVHTCTHTHAHALLCSHAAGCVCRMS